MKLGFIGIGNMGSAILRGACMAGLDPKDIGVYNRSRAAMESASAEFPSLFLAEKASELVEFSDIILLAVKPYQIKDLLSELSVVLKNKAIISVVAGVSTENLRKYSSNSCRVMRTMPNTSALVGESVSMLSNSNDLLTEELAFTEELFSKIGKIYYIDEKLIDAGSAVSGSGTAYAYMFMDALADGGVREGLPRKLAQEMAAQMLLGAAKMFLETGEHFGKLKDDVCSPGGTTIEAVEALERGGFRASLIDAVHVCKLKCDLLAENASKN